MKSLLLLSLLVLFAARAKGCELRDILPFVPFGDVWAAPVEEE